jgi:hypothetical protein
MLDVLLQIGLLSMLKLLQIGLLSVLKLLLIVDSVELS